MAPPGKHLFFMRRGLAKGTITNHNHAQVTAIAKEQMAIVRGAYTNFDELVEWEEIAVHWPFCWPSYSHASVPKAANRSPHIKHLYFIGDSTAADGVWFDRACNSALNGTDLLLEELTGQPLSADRQIPTS
jgi:hypothetical protein